MSKSAVTNLIKQAQKACQNAYAPYSNYAVGAALLLDNGKIITGANVENASFGGTVCAERSAIFAAISQGFRNFTAIAIVTESVPPAAPCGLCRQVLSEFSSDLPILLANTQGKVIKTDLNALMPMQFKLRN